MRAIVVRGRGEAFCVGADLSLLDDGASWIELSRFVARTEYRQVTPVSPTMLRAGGLSVL